MGSVDNRRLLVAKRSSLPIIKAVIMTREQARTIQWEKLSNLEKLKNIKIGVDANSKKRARRQVKHVRLPAQNATRGSPPRRQPARQRAWREARP
jgi:hypothetical protein